MAETQKARETVWLHPDNDIEADPGQPRVYFDRKQLIDLKANIGSEGLHEPIHVIRNPDYPKKKGSKPYRIVAGERRWRAICELELPRIEAFIEPNTINTLVFQLTENLHRTDLSAVEEARGYERLRVEYRLTAEVIAAKVGRSAFHVYQQLKLLGLHPELQKSNMEGGLSAQVGYLLVDNCTTPAEQLRVVQELRPQMHGTTRIRAAAVKRWFEARDRRRGDRKGDGKAGRLPKVSRKVLEGIVPHADKLAKYLEEFVGPEGSGELDMKFFGVWRKLAPEDRAKLLRSMRTIRERSDELLKFFAAQTAKAIGAARKAAWERQRHGSTK